tara:strand:- start:424 stop:909 length:486 start_codon:yes stop_codon:yes gene_type:complete
MVRDWVETPIGAIHFEATDAGLSKVGWGEVRRSDGSNEHLDAAKNWTLEYFAESNAPFPRLDESCLTPFQTQVLRSLVREAGFGKTVSYAELAAEAGHPGASRAVGSVMAMNPWPLLVPCHRVVRSDCVIGNYSGEGGPATKIRLLVHEGQKFDNAGRIAN